MPVAAPTPAPADDDTEQAPVGQQVAEQLEAANAPKMPFASPYAKDWEQLQKQQSALTGQQDDLIRRRRATMDPMYADARRAVRQPTPQPPRLQEQEPFNPPTMQAMQGWVSAAALLGALGGLVGRKSATTALNAMAGMNKGLAEGDVGAYNREYKTWEANSLAAAQNNRVALQRYNAILSSQKLDLEQKMNEIQIVSTQFQDELVASTAQQRNITQMAQLLEKRENALIKFTTDHDKIAEAHDATMLKANIELAKNGLKLDPKTGQVELDTSPDSPIEKQAQAIAAYKQPPLSSAGQRGALNRVIMGRVQEINKDYDAKQYNAMNAAGTSGARTMANRAANLELIINNVAQAAPAAIAASDAMPRGRWVPVNQAMQLAQQQGSDPKYRDFSVKNLQLAELWARAMNPTGVMRVEDRNLALGELSKAQSPQAYRAAVEAIVSAIHREKAALKTTKSEMGLQPPGAAPPPGGAPPGGAPGGDHSTMSDDELKEKLGL